MKLPKQAEPMNRTDRSSEVGKSHSAMTTITPTGQNGIQPQCIAEVCVLGHCVCAD